MNEVMELLREDAEHFICEDELNYLHTIVERATSAHRQITTHMDAIKSTKDHDEALQLVVDYLIEKTLIGA